MNFIEIQKRYATVQKNYDKQVLKLHSTPLFQFPSVLLLHIVDFIRNIVENPINISRDPRINSVHPFPPATPTPRHDPFLVPLVDSIPIQPHQRSSRVTLTRIPSLNPPSAHLVGRNLRIF